MVLLFTTLYIRRRPRFRGQFCVGSSQLRFLSHSSFHCSTKSAWTSSVWMDNAPETYPGTVFLRERIGIVVLDKILKTYSPKFPRSPQPSVDPHKNISN